MANPRRISRVNPYTKLTVVSSTPVEHGRSIRLNALDHAMAGHVIRLVHYYDVKSAGSVDFDCLRPSLCELLSMYPVMTGRLDKDEEGNWQVKCTDAGVRVLKAKVDAKLDEWLRSADLEEERDLTAWDDLPEDTHVWPPFRIQFSEFQCGGVAIGLSFTHLIGDLTTATFFFKSWSEAHRREAIAHPPFIQPAAIAARSPPFAATRSADYYASKASADAAAGRKARKLTATATFSFSDEVITAELSKIRPISPDATPFDFLAALFWSRINELSATEIGDNYKPCHSLSVCVDVRKRLHAPLPYGYFGNAVYFTEMEGGEVGFDDVAHVAELIRRHVAGIREDDVWSTVDSLDSRKDENGKFGKPFRMYGPELTCVNMEHLIGHKVPHGRGQEIRSMMYTSAFEDERKPVHVSYDVEDVGGGNSGEGLVFVMPSPEEGTARRVKVVLPEQLVVKLCEDSVIRGLRPTTMVDGGKIVISE